MPCIGPLTAYYGKIVNPVTGKRRLVFNKQDAFSGVPVSVPCGQCIECRLDYGRQWAIRLEKENKCHDVSTFITLTYDDDNLPADGSLVKEDLQAFHKRLHNRLLRKRGVGIRYYGAGEYGATFGRPHYHSIIFGYDFPDKKWYKDNDRGEPIYVSEFLRELWPAGRNGVGMVTFDSCMYVAGYVCNKISEGHDDQSRERFARKYGRYSSDGRFYLLQPEFSHMSRDPGIGAPYFQKFGSEVYRDDTVVVNGVSVRPPRYFDNLFEEVDSKRLSMLKRKRKLRAVEHSRGFTSRVSYARERIVKARLGLRRKDVS